MQAMVLEEDRVRAGVLAAALRAAGHEVLVLDRDAPAKEAARRLILDLLVLGERVGGRLAHDVALLAEWRNPDLVTVLLTDREGERREEIFDLIPSLRAAIPQGMDGRAVARLTLALLRRQDPGLGAPAAGRRPPPAEPPAEEGCEGPGARDAGRDAALPSGRAEEPGDVPPELSAFVRASTLPPAVQAHPLSAPRRLHLA